MAKKIDYDKMPTVKISPEAKAWIEQHRHGVPITKFLNLLFKEIIDNQTIKMQDGKLELYKVFYKPKEDK